MSKHGIPNLLAVHNQRHGFAAHFVSVRYPLCGCCPSRSFRVSCAALSPFERRLALSPSGLTTAEGWFKVCAAGGANSSQRTSAASATAAGSGNTAAASAAGTAASMWSLVPAAADPGTPSAITAGAAVGCSEYCARLAEAVYTVCDHALMLLMMTAPAVGPAELASGQGLGPMWPSVRALAAVMVSR